MCVRVADELKIFDILAEGPKTSAELVETTGAEGQLLVRVLRTLVAMGFVGQSGKTFLAVPVTHQITKASVRAGVKHL